VEGDSVQNPLPDTTPLLVEGEAVTEVHLRDNTPLQAEEVHVERVSIKNPLPDTTPLIAYALHLLGGASSAPRPNFMEFVLAYGMISEWTITK